MNIIETLTSVPFIVAITALVRKRWPQIDGDRVFFLVLALAFAGAALTYYRDAIPTEVWTAAGPILAAVLALGGVQTAQHVARADVAAFDASEAPTRKEGAP